jgi:hypothetical protein
VVGVVGCVRVRGGGAYVVEHPRDLVGAQMPIARDHDATDRGDGVHGQEPLWVRRAQGENVCVCVCACVYVLTSSELWP